jgi:intein/homing endonuclease
LTVNGKEIKVTPEHLVLVVKNGKNIQDLKLKLQRNIVAPDWIQAKQITIDDAIIKI